MPVSQQPGEGLSDEHRKALFDLVQGWEGSSKQERDIAGYLRSSASFLLHILQLNCNAWSACTGQALKQMFLFNFLTIDLYYM